ncbi:L-type lectin-domain containing receptor kinase IX.1 [Bienertia sinuspersici]
MPKCLILITKKFLLFSTIFFLLSKHYVTSSSSSSSSSTSSTCDEGSTIFNFPNFYTSNCKGGDLICMGAVSQGDGYLNLTTGARNSPSKSHFNSSGRVLYNKRVQIWPTSFCTSFSFRIFPHYNNLKISGDGLTFVIAQDNRSFTNQSFGSFLGLHDTLSKGNITFQQLAIEMDTFKNTWDPDDNHMAINTQSVMNPQATKSLNSAYIDLKSEKQIRVKIVYDGWKKELQIYVGYEGKPLKSFLNHTIKVSNTIPKYVYVGFTASTGSLTETCQLLDWMFTSSILPCNTLKNSKKKGIILARVIVPIMGCLVILSLVAIPFIRRRMIKKREWIRRTKRFERQYSEVAPRKFTYKQLAKATKNFNMDNLLGSGGFGSVYKGYIVDPPQTIAVKKISATSKQGDGEYLAELCTIGRLRHKNILQLRGWSHENEHLLLVYDFMSNKSLDGYFTGENHLNWQTRCKILTGLASALLYLHEECGDPIVHRDVKPNNIMLDEEFNPYLGDFGLARLLKNTTGVTTNLAGTLGYMAPELIYTSKATIECDVYSFGVVALELVSGMRFNNLVGNRYLMDYAWDMHRIGSLLECVDSKLGWDFEGDQALRILQVALACSHLDSNLRPNMRKVLMILSNSDEPLMELSNNRMKKEVLDPQCGISNSFCVDDLSNTSFITLPR